MKKFKVCMFVFCLALSISCISFGATFYDVKGTQYEGVVERISELGIINGISENTFAPNKGITRAELAKMIVYTKGLKDYADSSNLDSGFSDVGKKHWAKNYIRVAADLELLKGYDDGTFKPEKKVSYAETIAIALRILGYVNIDESTSPWYFGYTKRMYEIKLNQGMSTSFSSFTSPAKRGDVAVLWWNMLVSDRWAITSESESTGLTYTYSKITQLEDLFPDYSNVKGAFRGIVSESGDMFIVDIGGKEYTTSSNIPIYVLGASASGVYDKEKEVIYGLSFDDDISDYKIVSGPVFYLEDSGYNLKKAKTSFSYGSIGGATYAYLIVSKDEKTIYRVVYINASNSVIIDNIKVEYPSKKEDEEETGKVIINDEEYTTTDAVVIKSGKKVKWKDLSKNTILTELIKDSLYTYETKGIEGTITKYKDLDNLYFDGDKYIVANNCVYTIDDDDTVYDYKDSMTNKQMEKLVSRKTTIYLNVAEEIARIEFGKYLNENTDKKYEDSDYQFVYVTSIVPASDDNKFVIKGISLNDEKVSYKVSSKQACDKGDLVALSDISGRNAGKCVVVEKNSKYDNISVLYDTDNKYYNNAFGEYTLTDDTIIFKVTKQYADNSIKKIEQCNVYKVGSVSELGDLKKCKIHIFYNEDMNIDILVAELPLNKVTYQVARISEILDIKESGKDSDKNKDNSVQMVSARMYILDRIATRYSIVSGDALAGELVTFEADSKDEYATIKERFRTAFIGYKNDICIEKIKNGSEAEVKGSNKVLNLKEASYEYNGRIYDLVQYKYIFAKVSKNNANDGWMFTYAEFVDNNTFQLKNGDRIAFDELSGIAVIYRGYSE